MSLNLQNLRNNRDEILKAEIGSLLFNLGKTHLGIGNWQNYFENIEQQFGSYKEYYQDTFFENELKNINQQLKDFIFDTTDVNINAENKKWVEYFKGDVSNSDIVKKVFFRGCENVNSGIDKGSPKEQINSKLWIANAFGGFVKDVKKEYFDKRRECFFIALNEEALNNNWYQSPNFIEIRKFILKELKKWYSNLLSDNRFPVNDVTLYDQAYMSATMFKASLAGMLLNTTESQNYISSPQTIKWQILSVQYDKIGLAEKGLKPAHIIWYRERAKEVDETIKKVIEIDYSLGNEIYKDETGVYFLVPEGIEIFQELKNEILSIFKNIFDDEIYPYIGLSKASRGTMNLTYLLANAKANFLKADYSLKESTPIIENGIGICQVCQSRFATKQSDNTPMCSICLDRKKGRVDKWIENQSGETIWIGELSDKNSRIAMVTLKFELMEWLNGGLLSSLLLTQENYQNWLNQIEIFIKLFYSNIDILQINLSNLGSSITNEDRRILGRKNGLISRVKRDLDNLIDFRNNIKSNNLKKFNEQINTNGFTNILMELVDEFIKKVNSLIENIDKIINDNDIVSRIITEDIDKLNNLKNELTQYQIENFITQLTEDAYIGCKKWDENFNDYILQIFFGSIIGNSFENIIKRSNFNSKIDWENEIIKWNELEEDDIKLLSKLILQFILRKNPSPARLRRVWESTEKFFSDIKNDILGSLQKSRVKEEFLKLIEDFPKDREDKINSNNTIYKQYFSIIDPTPISWQFIIPTQELEDTIEKIQKLYYKNFKYVNGKLPFHIGIVVQNVKKPLYVGIKALRNIRRDIKEWQEIKKDSIDLLEDLDCYEKVVEQNNNSKDFYSLYETENQKYNFLLLPSEKGIKKYNSNEHFIIYPNSIDFEFLDTNSRRNDIDYKEGKRVIDLKSNRPYSWREWRKFKDFREKFKDKSSQLQTLVSLIYAKMEDWKDDEESFKCLMETTFKKEDIDITNFGIEDYSFEQIKKFLDMFAYYHTTIKEI